MTNIKSIDLKNNLNDYLFSAIDFNDIITVNTTKGNAVILSEEEYKSLIETLYLLSIPGMKDKIIESANSPRSDFVPFDEVDFDV